MRSIHLAILTLVAAYIATTAIGAALFTSEFGRDQLQSFIGREPIPFESMTTLGSPLYWGILLSLAVIAPIVALLTEQTARHFFTEHTPIDVPTWVAVVISAFLVAWCVYKLAPAGALSAHELWDRSVTFSQRMERRVELIRLLGNQYYAFAYSSLPILASFLLAKVVLQKDQLAFGAFCILSAILLWLDLAIIMKAPIIIYIGLMR